MDYVNSWDELEGLIDDILKILISMGFVCEDWYSYHKVVRKIIWFELYCERDCPMNKALVKC